MAARRHLQAEADHRGLIDWVCSAPTERAAGWGCPAAFDREAYRRRNVVERCVGRLKDSRRLAARYERLAVNFLAVARVAMITAYLRELFG